MTKLHSTQYLFLKSTFPALAELLAPYQYFSRRQASACVGLQEFLRNQTRTAWLLRFLLFVVGIFAILLLKVFDKLIYILVFFFIIQLDALHVDILFLKMILVVRPAI